MEEMIWEIREQAQILRADHISPTIYASLMNVANRLEDKTPEPLTKLEQFTMAAMQGRIANGNYGGDLRAQAKVDIRTAQAALAQLEEET